MKLWFSRKQTPETRWADSTIVCLFPLMKYVPMGGDLKLIKKHTIAQRQYEICIWHTTGARWRHPRNKNASLGGGSQDSCGSYVSLQVKTEVRSSLSPSDPTYLKWFSPPPSFSAVLTQLMYVCCISNLNHPWMNFFSSPTLKYLAYFLH